MKKINKGLVKGFVLCMLMFVCMQSYGFDVGAIYINTASYDIEMDDYYGKEKTTECTCEACVEERAEQREEDWRLYPFLAVYLVVAGIIILKPRKKR